MLNECTICHSRLVRSGGDPSRKRPQVPSPLKSRQSHWHNLSITTSLDACLKNNFAKGIVWKLVMVLVLVVEQGWLPYEGPLHVPPGVFILTANLYNISVSYDL